MDVLTRLRVLWLRYLRNYCNFNSSILNTILIKEKRYFSFINNMIKYIKTIRHKKWLDV